MALTLATLTGATILGATQGQWGDDVKEAIDTFKSQTSTTVYVKQKGDVSQKEVLSHAALYVYHRASNDGCKEVEEENLDNIRSRVKEPTVQMQNEGLIQNPDKGLPNKQGYPGLEGSFLGQEPLCTGTRSTSERGFGGVANDEGNDMEGIYSRLSFEVPQGASSFTLSSSGDTWLERHLASASREGFEQSLAPACTAEAVCTDELTDEQRSNLGCDTGSSEIGGPVGTSDNYIIYFREVGDQRITNPIQNGYPTTVYCNTESRLDSFSEYSGAEGAVPGLSGGDNTEIQFCPGDKGYIQLNKGDGPRDSDEAGETLGGTDRNLYPRIVVTSVEQENCGGG